MKKCVFGTLMTLVLLCSMVGSLMTGTFTVSVSAAPNAGTQGDKTTNVALNAQVTGSGQCNSNEAPKFAVDGKNDTKWCDATTPKQGIKWLKLDLGKVYTINQWSMKNGGINNENSPYWNTQNFRLQKSDDGKTWTDVDIVQNNVQSIVDRYLPEPFSAQYVRLYISKGAANDNTVRLYELELYGVEQGKTPASPAVNLAPVDYVDPFINTMGDNGQTNPGPTAPFGLVSLGPDSDGGAFSGYYYQDKYLKGFSHLRFSGVGCSGAGGNVLMMPETKAFTKNVNEYKQLYDKSSEQASAGYYAVNLASGVGVELTASDNVGFHRYTFPASSSTGSVLVDLSNSYAGMLDANLKVENSNEISGMIKSKNVCGNGYYTMYYSIQFDHNFDSYTSWQGDATGTAAERSGTNSGVWVNFNTAGNKVVQAKVGLSPISVDQAKAERDQDITGWNFDAQHEKLRNTWSDLLNKVEITDADEENKRVFYTQMYHTYLHPKNVTSSAGTFKAGRDESTIRKATDLGDDFEYYNGWTTWDDFRKYALFSVLTPKEYNNIVKSLADLYKTRGTYTQYGDGYWPSPTVRNEFNGAVLLDAYTKGFQDFDAYTSLKGMGVDTDNFSDQDKVSGQLEKAKSGYFPMKLAELLGDKVTYEKYKQAAQSYKKLWNPNQVDEKGKKLGFFTPNGITVSSGDVTAVDKYAYQGNLWQYRWSATQDMDGLAELMGGKTEMAKQLVDFFNRNEYMAINEEDLDAPYLFNYLGYPYLTQYFAREYTTEVVTQKYHNHGAYSYPLKSRVYRDDPEGYLSSMDDDAGAMSSWFVYSALGLFPGNPGDADFLIGSPIFSEVKLHLDGNKTFTIKANNVSSDNRFIQSATLNGKTFDQAWIRYEDLMAGGTLDLTMDSEPNMAWGAKASAAPPTTDYSGEVDSSLSHQNLIAPGSDWKYYDKGQYAGTGWTGANFNDSSWKSGAAPLGYDNKGYAKTVVSYGPDSSNKYATTYFRKTFNVTNTDDILELNANLVRDDGAVVYLNGQEIIRTNMPTGQVSYGTYANVTVNDERNWNAFSIDPSLLVKGTNVLTAEVHQSNGTSSDVAFDFGLVAVRQLAKPAAPTGPVVDDKANTFGWTYVTGFEQASDYQFSINGGQTWTTATSNPQIVGPAAYETGKVQVRVKANEELNAAPGEALLSDAPYTSDIKWDVFDLDAEVKRTGNMVVDVSGTLKGAYVDSAVAVIQLMTGGEQALVSSAIPVKTGNFDLKQSFNVNASKYQVNIYLVDKYNGNIYDSLWLADPIVSQPETQPEPGDPGEEPGNPGGEEPLPEPIAVPVKTPDVPGAPIEIEEPEKDPKIIEFEAYSKVTDQLHSNGNPVGTEPNNGGTVVKNTFPGAWLSYENVDFGTTGANRVTVEYDAPSQKAPADAVLEFRLGAVDGELAGTVALPNTGSGWGTYKTTLGFFNKTITGKQNLYIVMKGSTTSSLPYIGNLDRFTWGYEPIRTDYAKLELEKYNEWSTSVNPANSGPLKTEGGKSGQQVANTFNNAWMAYKGMDFGTAGVDKWSVEYSGNSTSTAADSAVELHLGAVDGPLVGRIAAPPTASSWGTYATVSGDLTQTLMGIQDLYIVLKGTTDGTYKYIGNFDNASFTLSAPPQQPQDGTYEFENKSQWSTAVNPFAGGTLKVEDGNEGTVVAGTFDGAWLSFANVNFGSTGMNHIQFVYDAPSSQVPADARAEIRIGGIAGTLVGIIDLTSTGSAWGTYQTAEADFNTTVKGTQNLYFVLKGSAAIDLPTLGKLDRFKLGYVPVRSDYAQLEMESKDSWSTGTNPGNSNPLKTETVKDTNDVSHTQVGNTFNGAWTSYKRMDFGSSGVDQWAITYAGNSTNTAPDSSVELHLDDAAGPLVGTLNTPPTAGSWGTYATVSGKLTETLTGIHDLYVVFKGTTNGTYKYIGNFDSAGFSLSTPQTEADVTVELENKSSWSTDKNTFNSNPLKTESNNGRTIVGNTFTGAWLIYNNVDFGVLGKNHVAIEYDAPTNRVPANAYAEIRLNDASGALIGTVSLPNTGSSWGTYTLANAQLNQLLTGKQNICLVLKGSTTSSLLYIGNFDRMIFSKTN